MKTFDLSIPFDITLPEFGYPYEEKRSTTYLVCSRVGTSVRVHARGDNYSEAVDTAADYCIKYHKKYFVCQIENTVRIL